ncbi:MAG: undecaprenyldiphospho-muramoylpentapeptide beta-N-acetylglucosaminyltransferase [Spirochaetota bacterium]|nr:undecaprenyldiphospho-muramoylpentapeptide beta-N-acetylglucosaminyltransferase [Spirochaetota bacterium]
MSNINVMITGGGTGGHISPGIALYEEMRERGMNAYILVGRKDKGFSPLEEIDKDNVFYYRAPSFSKNPVLFLFFILRFIIAVLNSIRILRKIRADAVIGMGGYVSAPAITAALLLKIKIFLCEQNSVPGKVITKFAKYSENIFTTFDVTQQYIDTSLKPLILNTGNPLREDILLNIDKGKNEARGIFSLAHCKKVILIIGGSQGALAINELIFSVKRENPDLFKDIGVIWSTGEYSYQRFKDKLKSDISSGSIYLSPFIDNIAMAYRASNIAIARSGAGVMMELAAVGLPSILIPYPYATSNHQETNADVFVNAGAALKLKDKDADSSKTASLLADLLSNPTKLKKMSLKAKSMSRPNASSDIIDAVVNKISE